jgi:hypothetical protein
MKMFYNSRAVLSGSAALKLISGKNFHPSDIDFIVPATRAPILFSYLLTKGFQLDLSFGASSPAYSTSFLHIFRFAQADRSIDITLTPVRLFFL